MPSPLRFWTRARRGALVAGVTITVTAFVGSAVTTSAVAAGLPAPSTTTSVTSTSATSATSSVAACASVLSGARRPKGKSAADPNDLTRAGVAKAEQQFDAQLQSVGLTTTSVLPGATITVPIRYHVIVRDDGSGAPTRAQLSEQIAVLNQGYSGTSSKYGAKTLFRFVLGSVDVTRNSDWYDWSLFNDTDDQEAKKALHVGGKRDLNVYVTGLADGLLGYSNFPFDKEPLWEDGVVILTDSLPGGSVVPYNEGDTLTHEAGHWLGLLHTFENGCTAPGDEVPDTPYQADGDNIFYCNESDDTCPAPGADPVHNFMSYGDDPCLDRFSRGQAYRMALVWFAFRSGLKFGAH